MGYTPRENHVVTKPQPKSWEERDKRIDKLASDYTQTFKNTSSIYKQAVDEGWCPRLIRYVWEVAKVQAQYIESAPNVGWDGAVIFNHERVKYGQWKGFLAEQKRIASTGSIDVGIPTGLTAEWKKEADIGLVREAEKIEKERARTLD